MKGYVENVGNVPIYIFKGVVNHGERISFDRLLKRFGSVVGTDNEKVFGEWLSKNKFIDRTKWKIVVGKKKIKIDKDTVEDKKIETKEITPEKTELKKIVPEKIESEETEVVSKVTTTNKEIIKKVVTGVTRELTADNVANMTVAEMNRRLPVIDDMNLLKLALKKAENMTQKATICNKLRDRITQLSVR